jgi:hypothetical protein
VESNDLQASGSSHWVIESGGLPYQTEPKKNNNCVLRTRVTARISSGDYLISGFVFSLITVKEYFLPVVAAALDIAVVVSSKLLLSDELKITEAADSVDFPGTVLPAGLKKYFFNSWDNFA